MAEESYYWLKMISAGVCTDGLPNWCVSDRAQSQDGQKQSADFFASTANSHPSVKRCQASLEPVT